MSSAPLRSSLKLLNPAPGDAPPPSPLPSSFTLVARSDTDIWRKPPSTLSFNAPILYHSLKLSEFKRARVSITGPWKTLYDQGGLCLCMPTDKGNERSWKWLKTGIEFYDGRPYIGTVGCDTWADWSLLELDGDQVTVEIEREVENGNKTASLWVYIISDDGKRRPIREVTWVIGTLSDTEQNDQSLCIGVYAAKPKMDEGNKEGKLEVTFQLLEIETWKGLLEL